MPEYCPNCGREIQGGMKFCPNCGQDQSIVVPQDQRIPTEDVPVLPATSGDQGGGNRRLVINIFVVALIVLGVLVAIIVKGAGNSTSTTANQEPAEEKNEEVKETGAKAKADPRPQEVSVGEVAELRDRTLVINEVERNYLPPTRFTRVQPGYELVRVYLTLKNTGNQQFPYNPLNFEVQDSNGVQKERTPVTEIPYPIETGDLAPGGTLEGNLVFEVPEGDRGLDLVYEPFEHRNVGTITVGL